MNYKTQQLTLTGEETRRDKFFTMLDKEYSQTEALSFLDRIDWDFKDFTTQYLSHKFHSYPARFIPQIPLTFIKLFTNKNDNVLDPFCGCGTTLVEAFLNNRNSVGNDFNPLAVLISKVKTTLVKEEEFGYLDRKLSVMKRYLDLDHKRIEKRTNNLPNRNISKIFNKSIIAKLEAIRETILEVNEEGHQDVYDLCRVALSSTIWSLVENGSDINVDNIFLNKVQAMRKELQEMSRIVKIRSSVKIIHGDARDLNVGDDSIDLIVTSPPYVNALDYYRAHMYNMLWLGMDFDLFRKHEIGGHSHFISNRFRLLSEYLGDMLRSMIEMNRTLKKDEICAIVVGNSSLEYELIESHKYFVAFADDIGFKHIKTIFRRIDKTKKYTSADIGQIDDEYIVVLKKVDNSGIKAKDDDFVSEKVTEQMQNFMEQIKRVQGTSLRGKKPTKERLLKNIDRISEAIETIPDDIKING